MKYPTKKKRADSSFLHLASRTLKKCWEMWLVFFFNKQTSISLTKQKDPVHPFAWLLFEKERNGYVPTSLTSRRL